LPLTRVLSDLLQLASNLASGSNLFLLLHPPFPLSALSYTHCLLTYVQALSDQLEAQDVEEFTKEVQTYDAVSRLDQWYTTMLLRIKKQIPDEGELC
jgi:hypothetical protein